MIKTMSPMSRSNGDRIRAMSDEELRDFICEDSEMNKCIHCVYSKQGCFVGADCKQGILEWLKSKKE